MPRRSQSFADECVALAWGGWVELGVSGWGATHGSWAVDPEPLIVFTAWLGDRDARLLDEATDWCVRYASRLSKVRLKNLVKAQPEEVQRSFGEFAATVTQHSGVSWPLATTSRRYRVTGKSTLPPLDRPSLAWLRLRAVFGLGARTEVLRYFLTNPMATASVAGLAQWTGYAKRNVAEACEALHEAGELRAKTIGNRFAYSMERGALVRGFTGLPPVRPYWPAVCDVARELAELESETQQSSPRTVPVKVRQALTRIEGPLDDLGVETVPAHVRGAALWDAVTDLDGRTLRRWAVGKWPE